jgi:CBS domain-containing protein
VDFHLHLSSETAERAHPAVPLCVESHTTIRAALVLMKEKNRGAVLVCFQGRLAGIFTERDALRCMAQARDLDVPIQQVMSEAPTSLSSSDAVGTAIAKMAEGGYRRLPIVDSEGRPTGILKVSGILNYLVEHFPKVIYNLPPKPEHTTQHREGA